MNFSVPTAASRTFERIDSLIHEKLELLKEYGICLGVADHPHARCLIANSFVLKLKLENQQSLSAYISNPGIPQGKLPKQRYIEISGTVAAPLLEGQPIDDVFWDLIECLHIEAFGTKERIPV
jgi:hypothetical protein